MHIKPVHTSDIVEATFGFVEATFDIVERIAQLVAFDNVAWTLLLVWTGLCSSTAVRLMHALHQNVKGNMAQYHS